MSIPVREINVVKPTFWDRIRIPFIKIRWKIEKFIKSGSDKYWYGFKLNLHAFIIWLVSTKNFAFVFNVVLNGLMIWYTVHYFGNIISFTFLIILVEHYVPWLIRTIKHE
jgi:hypothetical protein